MYAIEWLHWPSVSPSAASLWIAALSLLTPVKGKRKEAPPHFKRTPPTDTRLLPKLSDCPESEEGSWEPFIRKFAARGYKFRYDGQVYEVVLLHNKNKWTLLLDRQLKKELTHADYTASRGQKHTYTHTLNLEE